MRAFVKDEVIGVVLSRRNLRALLAKLDEPESARTLYSDYQTDGKWVFVHAEDDDVHYRDREPPGPIHPRTEATPEGE